jgi:hypothetical protein
MPVVRRHRARLLTRGCGYASAFPALFLDPGQRADHVIGELASEHGPQLCHFTQPRHPIEPCHQRILQCLRDVQLCQRAREHIGVASGLEHPRTEDGLGQLLDVERHAVGLGNDMIDHLAGQGPAGVPSAVSISQATIASRVASRCCCAVSERRE